MVKTANLKYRVLSVAYAHAVLQSLCSLEVAKSSRAIRRRYDAKQFHPEARQQHSSEHQLDDTVFNYSCPNLYEKIVRKLHLPWANHSLHLQRTRRKSCQLSTWKIALKWSSSLAIDAKVKH
eukprot:4016493-Amphidinium_carterae.1